MITRLLDGHREALDELEAAGDYVCFDFAGSSLAIYCDDPDVIPWLTQYFSGYFVPSSNKSPDALVYLSRDRGLFEKLNTRAAAAREPSADEYANVEIELDEQHVLIFDGLVSKKKPPEKICYLLSQQGRQILASFTGPTNVRQVMAVRLVRNVMNLLMYEKGWLPIHAAACVRNGAGISIIGGKGAGKTSTLLNLLDQPGTKLVTNDRLFLRDAVTHLEGCGFPSQAGLRVDLLLNTPKLQHWLEQATDSFYPQIGIDQLRKIADETPPAELKARKEKFSLIPSELAASFATEIKPLTRIDLFVAVRYDPQRKEANFAPVERDDFLEEAAALASSLARRQAFLRKLFRYDDDELRQRLQALLAKHYPTLLARELHQNEHTNSQSIALIDTAVSERQFARREAAVPH